MTYMNSRHYDMSTRSEAAGQTADRLLDAMLARFATTPFERIRLEDVAADAGVTVQTAIRRFSGKAGLLLAVVERELGSIAAAREAAAQAKPAETVTALVAHYERYGHLILKTYAEAPLVPGLPELAARGRAFHVDWCTRTFGGHLPAALDDDQRRLRLATVVALADATTWRILREDGGLSPAEVERALSGLLLPLVGASSA
jgi:AcrR family transcriptional regulator